MTLTIKVNGLELSHKGSGGMVQNTVPDVCLTPAGPTMVPVPYQIVSFSRDLVRGTTTVLADGGHMISNLGSAYATCIGDAPGTGLGVASGTILHEATWITFSPNVFMEGRNACRKTDKMFMNNKNTISGTGGDYEPPVRLNDLEKELCRIFCEASEKWEECKNAKPPRKCDKPSKTAKELADKRSDRLNRAVSKQYPGHTGHAEKSYLTKLDDGLKKVVGDSGRKIYSSESIRNSIMRKFRNQAFKEAAEKGAKMAARGWMKLVPGLNIISTAYDVYDGVMTAKEVYDAARTALKNLDAQAARIRPDFAIEGPDGSLKDTYDFKFGNDDWQDGQEKLYEDATGERPKKIDEKTCRCKSNSPTS